MSGDNPAGMPTRRDYVTYCGTVVGVGLLGGCSGVSDGTGTPQPTDAETASTTEAEPETTTTGDGSHSVTMEPVGTVEFEEVPETVAPFTADYIDMMVALGHGDAAHTIWYENRYKTGHYDELDGVSIDAQNLTPLLNDGISKELFYEIDADLHLIDPHSVTHWMGEWTDADIEEIRSEVGPFLGNLIFRRTDDWHDYRYYTLYEAFEKVAQIFQEQDRYESIRAFHQELVDAVQSRLPPESERPNAALMYAPTELDDFVPYRLSGLGTNKEHFHTLGIKDAFADTGVEGYSGSQSVDYETLLEIDPDSLLLRGHGNKIGSRAEFESTIVEGLRDHEVGSQLTAVQEGKVFRGGPIYCGPLHNLFMLERYARAYYPDEFSEEQLFDRDELAMTVTDGDQK